MLSIIDTQQLCQLPSPSNNRFALVPLQSFKGKQRHPALQFECWLAAYSGPGDWVLKCTRWLQFEKNGGYALLCADSLEELPWKLHECVRHGQRQLINC